MKFLSVLMFCLGLSISSFAAEDISGVWKTIDDESGEAKSLVQIYPYQGKMYGRVIALFKNKDKVAVGIQGDPKILGLDVIWDLENKGERWKGGRILDPQKGKIYACEVWRDENQLIVRGKIGPFGRNQTWVFESDIVQEGLVPSIPMKK